MHSGLFRFRRIPQISVYFGSGGNVEFWLFRFRQARIKQFLFLTRTLVISWASTGFFQEETEVLRKCDDLHASIFLIPTKILLCNMEYNSTSWYKINTNIPINNSNIPGVVTFKPTKLWLCNIESSFSQEVLLWVLVFNQCAKTDA